MAKKWTVEKINYDSDEKKILSVLTDLEADMRDRDKIDLLDSCGDVAFGLVASIRYSEECYVYYGENNEVLCIVGKGYAEENAVGRSIWMVGTEALNAGYVKSVLIKEGKRLIGEWVEKHGLLFNCVHEDNEKSIRYMTMLGAKWLPETFKVNGKRFKNFYIVGGGK